MGHISDQWFQDLSDNSSEETFEQWLSNMAFKFVNGSHLYLNEVIKFELNDRVERRTNTPNCLQRYAKEFGLDDC